MNTHDYPEYGVWCEMKARCRKSHHKHYVNYGARGIKVCDRWNLFYVFLEDMGRRPSDNHTIERIDNEGDYEPSNCKWATRKEQIRNRRNSIILEYEGKKITLQDIADKHKVRYQSIVGRYKNGWSVSEKILKSPLNNLEASRLYGVSKSTVSYLRIKAGIRQHFRKKIK